jgi:integrase
MAIKSVDGLRAGRSAAREGKKVKPVPVEQIEAIRPFMNSVPMAVIDLLLLTGARVGEITSMRTCDVDVSEEPWVFTPESHKTNYTGRKREIMLGQKAMSIVKEYLRPDEPAAYLFQPKDAERIRRVNMRANRKTPVQPSQIDRSKPAPKRKPGERYEASSIRTSVQRACKKAGIPDFHPHQIRHTVATNLRKLKGIEVARIVLGHSSAFTTEIYAEADLAKVRDTMLELG